MTRIFFAGLEPAIKEPSEIPTDELFIRVGQNTGNLLFTSAVYRQLRFDVAEHGRLFDPDHVNAAFDVVVIPAANWLYERWNFTWLAELVERLRIPCVMIGVGAQASTRSAFPELKEGTVRLMRAVSERSASIGVRGEFSRALLARYGVHNVQVIGCPSLYTFPEGLPARRDLGDPTRVIFGGTRYALPSEADGMKPDAHRRLYEWAFADSMDMLYQSERPEFDLLVTRRTDSVPEDVRDRGAAYYGTDTGDVWAAYVLRHGHVYFDVDQWIAAMREHSLYIGTRIHGAIASLLAGTPALLLTHDSRTAELAEVAGIPTVPLASVRRPSWEWARSTLADVKVDTQATVDRLLVRYRRFLEGNGLEHQLSG